MRSTLSAALCALSLLIAAAVDQSARATINAHQEQIAEAICQADPSRCGL